MTSSRWLNLTLDDSTGAPIAERPYTLEWVGAPRIAGLTDDRGRLSIKVPPGVVRASLVVLHRKIELELDALPSLDTVEGVQERLNQLNYFAGRVDGDHGPRTSNGLESFQRAHGLEPTGEADAETKARIERVHGGGK